MQMNNIRNIGIIAHIDAGKTTVTERMLFYSRRIHRMGEVHDGNATMDFMPEEQERGITISAACTTCDWRGHSVNVVDTPGHVDFTIEVDRCLRVLDGAIGIFCAVGGVEPQSETVWRQSEKYGIAKIAFINKLDRPGANFENVLDSMRLRLGVKPLLLQLPVGQGREFTGILDLLKMEKLVFHQADKGSSWTTERLTEEERAWAEPWRKLALEMIVEQDDKLLEAYLNEQSLEPAALLRAIRKGTFGSAFVPVLLGSALKNSGIQPLLDAVVDFLPSPADLPPTKGISPRTQAELLFANRSDGPLSALAFKVVMEGARKLVFVRLYSGQLSTGSSLYNSTQDIVERAGQIFLPHAGSKEPVETAGAGQIVALGGLKQTTTADTLCQRDNPIILERIAKYKPVISFALEARNMEERKELYQALTKVVEEDPTLFFTEDEESEQFVLSGMGELHLTVVIERLRREQKIDFRLGNPEVFYQETVCGAAQAEEEYCRELREQTHAGHARLRVESARRGTGNALRLELDGGEVDAQVLQAVLDGLKNGLESGVVKGYPMQDVHVYLQELRPVPDGSPAGYRMAAVRALQSALAAACPALLEPIMDIEISVPQDFLGDCIALLNSRGGRIQRIDEQKDLMRVVALAPLRQTFGFSTQLRSVSQGRAGLNMSFSRFDFL